LMITKLATNPMMAKTTNISMRVKPWERRHIILVQVIVHVPVADIVFSTGFTIRTK